MKLRTLILIAAAFTLLASSCDNGKEKGSEAKKYSGIIFNEVAAHDETGEFASWVELYNTSSETISLEGLSFFITDKYFKGQKIGELSGSMAPGERKVISTEDSGLATGFASNAAFKLVLGPSNSDPVVFFEHKDDEPSLGYFASWQRIPDVTGEMRKLTYASPGKPNELFDFSKTRRTAVWTWGSHLSDLIADNGAKMRELKRLGYDHILMNYAGYSKKNYHNQAVAFTKLADEIGLTVHVWLQAFYEGDWICPIDDDTQSYKEEVFERIRNDAVEYLENWAVKGVHLDYIRFGGTANKHNYGVGEDAVNSVNAVNRCCREIREICDGYDEGLITSAALMPEANSSQYYGQKPADMAKYIHVLMPMIYRYGSYNMSDDTFRSNSNYFADQAAKSGGVSWSGIQTYDANTKGMTAEALRRDIDLMAETRSEGIVLFRYQLGTYPDINDLFK